MPEQAKKLLRLPITKDYQFLSITRKTFKYSAAQQAGLLYVGLNHTTLLL